MLQKHEVIFPTKGIIAVNSLMGTDGHRWKGQQRCQTVARCQRRLLLEQIMKVVGDSEQEDGGECRIEGVSKPPGHGKGWGTIMGAPISNIK